MIELQLFTDTLIAFFQFVIAPGLTAVGVVYARERFHKTKKDRRAPELSDFERKKLENGIMHSLYEKEEELRDYLTKVLDEVRRDLIECQRSRAELQVRVATLEAKVSALQAELADITDPNLRSVG